MIFDGEKITVQEAGVLVRNGLRATGWNDYGADIGWRQIYEAIKREVLSETAEVVQDEATGTQAAAAIREMIEF